MTKSSLHFIIFNIHCIPCKKITIECKLNKKELKGTNMRKGFTLAEVKRMFPRPFGERVRVRGKKAAFTLAEVLITLGVIGVVAAMTMPTVIKKYNEHVTVNKVKKFYSVMNQSLMLSIKDNGFVDEWNYTNVNQFADYIKPYLKIVKDCQTNSGCIGESYKYLNETGSVNYNSNGTNYDYYKLFLADGTSLWFRIHAKSATTPCVMTDGGTPNVCGLLWIDVNGKKNQIYWVKIHFHSLY